MCIDLRSVVMALHAIGVATGEVLADHPGMAQSDVLACITHRAEMSLERGFAIPVAASLSGTVALLPPWLRAGPVSRPSDR